MGADGKPVGGVNFNLGFETPDLVALFQRPVEPDPRVMAMMISVSMKLDRLNKTLGQALAALDRLERTVKSLEKPEPKVSDMEVI